MNIREAIDILNNHGYQMLNEWKITSDFDELSAADKKTLTSAMNSAYTALKSGNKKKLTEIKATLKHFVEELSNPKAMTIVLRMASKIQAALGESSDTKADTTSKTTKPTKTTATGKTLYKSFEQLLEKGVDYGLLKWNKDNTELLWTDDGKAATKRLIGKDWFNEADNFKNKKIATEDASIWVPETESIGGDWTYISRDHLTSNHFNWLLDFFTKLGVGGTSKLKKIETGASPKADTTVPSDICAKLDVFFQTLANKNMVGLSSRKTSWEYTTLGHDFTKANFDGSWCNTADDLDNGKVLPDSDIWFPTNLDDLKGNWTYYKAKTFTDAQLKAYYEIYKLDVPSDISTPATSTPTADKPLSKKAAHDKEMKDKAFKALIQIFGTIVGHMERHGWIAKSVEDSSGIHKPDCYEYTPKGQRYTKRVFGHSWLTFITDYHKTGITMNSKVLLPTNYDAMHREKMKFEYIKVTDVTYANIEAFATAIGCISRVKSSGVLRYLSDRYLPLSDSATSGSTSSMSITDRLQRVIETLLSKNYILKDNDHLKWTAYGHDWTNANFHDAWSVFSWATWTGTVRPSSDYWLPDESGSWQFIEGSNVKEINIKPIEEALGLTSTTSSTTSASSEPVKPSSLPETVTFTEYHFMLSFTKEDTDDSDKMEPNLDAIMTSCDQIEKLMTETNKEIAPYGLKCTCDWDNDDAHYFYGKFWYSTVTAGSIKLFPKSTQLYDKVSNDKRRLESNSRVIDYKFERLRDYKAHKI